MSTQFIPNGDREFQHMAKSFADTIAAEPARFAVAQDDADALSEAVEQYSAALQRVHKSTRTLQRTRAKNEARKEAERIIRRLATTIRVNDAVEKNAKFALKLKLRSGRPKAQPVPDEPPRLRFMRALHSADAPLPKHELRFSTLDCSRTRPAGAVRLELFVDLVPPDEPIPTYPGANLHGRPWYLRSYTRSPIVIAPPMMVVPMRVVYWGRWADASGGFGPFSATCAAWVEDGSRHTRAVFDERFRPTIMPQIVEPKALPVFDAGQEMRVESPVRGHLPPAEDTLHAPEQRTGQRDVTMLAISCRYDDDAPADVHAEGLHHRSGCTLVPGVRRLRGADGGAQGAAES